jgi:hypothetical protein
MGNMCIHCKQTNVKAAIVFVVRPIGQVEIPTQQPQTNTTGVKSPKLLYEFHLVSVAPRPIDDRKPALHP